jgi:hypothetical protein
MWVGFLVLIFAVPVAKSHFSPVSPNAQYDVQDFVRMRCSLDSSEDVFMQFSGNVFSEIPQQKQKLLFKTLGMNIARCIEQKDGSYVLTSRELLYYLDPITGEKLLNWTNPWTNETLNVVHVANDPVQSVLTPGAYEFHEDASTAIMAEDIPLFYPNPLANNASFAPYSPFTWYQAAEYFHFEVATNLLQNRSISNIPWVHLAWFRTSQFLPFMKMGTSAGSLSFSSYGSKLQNVEQLDPLLQRELRDRVPLFAHAPPCLLVGPSVSSWTYFEDNFESYLLNEEFPIPVSRESRPCA